MPKLYYTPTSCGAASFIAASKAGVKLEAEQVNIGTHKTDSGADFYAINPKGNVPTLVLDDGTVLNENVAVLSKIAELAGAGALAPAPGTPEAALVLNHLSYICSDVHAAGFGPLFGPFVNDEAKAKQHEKLAKKLTYINDHMVKGKKFLVGDSFTVADSYLYIVLSWGQYVGVDTAAYPEIARWWAGIAELDFVKAAHARMAEKPAATA